MRSCSVFFRTRNFHHSHCSRLALTLLLFLAFTSPALAAPTRDCPDKPGKTVRNLQSVQIDFETQKNEDYQFGQSCQVTIRDSRQKVVFSQEDADFSIVMAGSDVNGDSVPDLVLESYSGGAHCCWAYYVISLGEAPHLIKKFENERGAAFVRNTPNGRIEIITQDGAFDYFDGQCHACTVFPTVYLRLEGEQLVDCGSSHVKSYDEIIAKNQKELTAQERQSIHSAQGNPYDADDDMLTTTKKIFNIVFAYLYSGREVQAHQALEELWPASDQQRLWNLILETRKKGVLSQTRTAPLRLP